MLLLTLSQTLLDLLKSETTHRFDREEMRVHACLYMQFERQKKRKKRKKESFLRVINFYVCPGL